MMSNVVTRVELVMADRVRLRQLTRGLKNLLVKNGFDVVPDGNGYPSVLFDQNDDSSLRKLFKWLALHNVAFVLDVKDIGGGPSGLMELIASKEDSDTKYLSCTYDGNKWIYHEKT